jgi:hypothetical protein
MLIGHLSTMRRKRSYFQQQNSIEFYFTDFGKVCGVPNGGHMAKKSLEASESTISELMSVETAEPGERRFEAFAYIQAELFSKLQHASLRHSLTIGGLQISFAV